MSTGDIPEKPLNDFTFSASNLSLSFECNKINAIDISGLWQIFEVFQSEMKQGKYAVYGCLLCLPKSFCFTKDVCTVP